MSLAARLSDATPKLEVMGTTSVPRIALFALASMSARMRSAIATASCGVAPGSTMQNSSPP